MIWIQIVLLPLLCGVLLYLCFRAKKTAYRVLLILAALACAFVWYASTNPIPGSEGPGLLAIMFVALTFGALLAIPIIQFFPKFPSVPRSPAILMSLWLLATFVISPIAAFTSVILCGTNFEGAALSVLVLIPLLYGMSGWLMPKKAHPKSLFFTSMLLLAWSLIPAGLIYWSETSNSIYATCYSFLTLPNRISAPILYSSLFYTPQSAFGLEVLRPMAVASTQLLLTGTFSAGMLIKHQKEII